MMDSVNQSLALAHAAREFPREACGLLVIHKGRETYVPCRNICVGTDQFVIHPEDYVRADRLGEVVGVFHSHPNLPAEPSQADKVACETSGLPWFILSFPSGQWHETQPSGYIAPLVGRAWAHGVLDCYSVIRDWYRAERGIDLPNFDRFDEWWKRGQSLYLDNFDSAGFDALGAVQSQDMEVGDVLLMQVASPVPNHAAIYLGDGLILHHLQGRLSSRDVYGGYWQKITTHILRHRTEITQPP
jgi:proteasome lid subunit RPN8/RPN11